MSFLSHVAGPLIALPPPVPGVTITIKDGKEQVNAGQTVRYDVIVHNAGEAEAPLTIKLTVPAHAVTGLQAPDAAACATDRDKLATASSPEHDPATRRIAWIAAIFFGLLAVAGALWLYRKINPEPLTPATVRRAAQPGGAPSE